MDHPNIVKFKGVFYNEATDESILVMEVMMEDLHQYLERNRGQLSHQKQIEICISIVCGSTSSTHALVLLPLFTET